MSDTLDAQLIHDPVRFAEAIVARGLIWCDRNAAAELLEETKKSVLAQIMANCIDEADGKLSVAAAEMRALASAEYGIHISKMVEARREANRARVSFDGAKAFMELARSAEATRRAETNIR